ncbi:MAG: GEVED domain-containing protein, partial [Bacteroidota bacterium]
IIGAKGNNGIGVTGINWNVKLMIVVGGFGQAIESRIIEAYDYSLTQRRLYNETNGEKGAFVVATNSSWGVSKKFPEEFPLWCAVYDSLGMAGVINIAATDNKDVDVDAEGDMPTSCESDFLISVTNVGGTGAKVADAGFGATSIDLGAFGDQIFTTGDDNSYTENRGTSYSAPMVTGAIGLLYAANCASLSAIYKESPVDGALKVKDVLLRSVDPEPTLDGITVTGGRLNIHKALQLLLDECGDCPPLLQVGTEELTDTETNIKWLTNDLIERVDFRWRQLGESEWITEENVSSPSALDSLIPCTSYEYQFRVYCENDLLDFAERTFVFKTDGCCDPPANFQSTFIGNVSIAFKWDPVLAAEGYTLRYRAVGTEAWIERFAPSTNRSIPQLTSCTNYEFQVRSNCVGEESEFSQSLFLGTFGCGACLDQNYCTPLDLESSRSSSEWIAGVSVNGIDNNSDGQGYSDFTGLMLPDLTQGDTVRIRLSPGYSGFAFDEFFKVWIDFDQDGFFSSLDVAFETPDFINGELDTAIVIPEDAMLGKTRMRVIMKFNSEPSACVGDVGSFFGEVEDYCVNIVEAVATSTKNLLAQRGSLSVFPNPVNDQLNLNINLQTNIDIAELEIVDLAGRVVQQVALESLGAGRHRQLISTQNWGPGVYFVRMKTEIGTLVEKVIKY